MPAAQIPPDAVTSSGSGLDPDISPGYAAIQVDRVAAARGPARGRGAERWCPRDTHGRDLWIFGEPGVNVLQLNLALDSLKQG